MIIDNFRKAFKDINYEEYEKKLKSWKVGEDSLFDNEDICCAEIVTRKILENAQSNGKVQPVYMFCQNFTLFRKSTRKAFHEKKLENYFDKTQDTLFEYLSKDGSKMTVYTENDVRNLNKESIWDNGSKPGDNGGKRGLGYYVEKGNIQFRYITVPLADSHFMVAGNSYRCEKSEEYKTATCGENEEFANGLRRSVDFYYKYSRPIVF